MVASALPCLASSRLLWSTRENANSRVELDSYRTNVAPPSSRLCVCAVELLKRIIVGCHGKGFVGGAIAERQCVSRKSHSLSFVYHLSIRTEGARK